VRSVIKPWIPRKAAARCLLAAASGFSGILEQLPARTCFSNKLSNSYEGLTLDLSTKCIGRNQAIVRKACHIVISAHGDRLWRTQEFFWINFAIACAQEIIDLPVET
jgi:hypothetical protein